MLADEVVPWVEVDFVPQDVVVVDDSSIPRESDAENRPSLSCKEKENNLVKVASYRAEASLLRSAFCRKMLGGIKI